MCIGNISFHRFSEEALAWAMDTDINKKETKIKLRTVYVRKGLFLWIHTPSTGINTIFVLRRLFHPSSVLRTYTAVRFDKLCSVVLVIWNVSERCVRKVGGRVKPVSAPTLKHTLVYVQRTHALRRRRSDYCLLTRSDFHGNKGQYLCYLILSHCESNWVIFFHSHNHVEIK